jgi:hypothetical protein
MSLRACSWRSSGCWRAPHAVGLSLDALGTQSRLLPAALFYCPPVARPLELGS